MKSIVWLTVPQYLYEEYTDESPATDFNATAQKVQGAMDRALQSLKTEVEARRKS